MSSGEKENRIVLLSEQMDGLRGCLQIMERNKPYLIMILIQFVYAGMALFSKAAITQGMNAYIFVVYRQAFATLALAPFAFFLERKKSSLSFVLLCKIFVVSTGITLALNLFYFALNYVSATFATALTNMNLAITLFLAVCFRMESISINQRHGLAKVIGSVLALFGALLCTFVEGPAMYRVSGKDILHLEKQSHSKGNWIKGSLIILASNTAWCSWLIMQAPLVKQYPAKLRLTALQCLCSCITSVIWAAARERKLESWKLGWNVDLLSVFYCGVIVTAITYWLQVWVVEKKGPVFTALFGPLALIITAIFSALLFQETLHWGSVCGAILLVAGVYSILWGKVLEEKAKESTNEAENEEKVGRRSEEKLQMKDEEELEGITCHR